MEKLIGEYISLLSEKTEPSTRFWALDERMKEDKGKKGVVIQKEKFAIKELELEIGKEAYAVIKATSVMVGIE